MNQSGSDVAFAPINERYGQPAILLECTLVSRSISCTSKNCNAIQPFRRALLTDSYNVTGLSGLGNQLS